MVYPLHPPNRKTSIFQNFMHSNPEKLHLQHLFFQNQKEKKHLATSSSTQGALWAVFHAVFPHCFVSTAVGVEYTSPLHLQGEAPEHTQEWPQKSWIIVQSDLKKTWPTWRPTDTPWLTKTHRPWSMTSHDAPFRPSPVSVALLPTTQRVGTAHRCGGPKIPAISSMMCHRLCGAVSERGKKKATALCWRFVKFLQKEKFLISCTSHGSSQLLSMRDSSCWLGEWPPPAPRQNHAFLVFTPNNPKTTNGEKWRCFRVYQLVLVTSIWEVVKCAQMTLMPYDHHYPTPNVCIRATTCTSWSSHFWALADDPAPGTAWQIFEVLHGWFEVTRGSFPKVTKHCSSF